MFSLYILLLILLTFSENKYLYRMKYVLYFSSKSCIYSFFTDIFRNNLKIIIFSVIVTGVQSIYVSCSLFMELYVY